MKIYSSVEELNNMPECAVALGNFDGVHKGHAQLISACVRYAAEQGISSCVFTFTNHPANEIAGRSVVKTILGFEEKSALLENLGVDILVSVSFDEYIRTLSPEDFISELLLKRLNMKAAFCGFNFNFGFMAKGTPSLLKELSLKYGFESFVQDAVVINGSTVSSTLLRQFITSGRLDEFTDYTGRAYTIDGKVIEGQRLGRTIGFPTANLNLSEDMALPANGVYVTRTYIDGQAFPSVTNVGIKPTVGTFGKNAETHIFDFHKDIYGKPVRVEFVKMLRPEKSFASIEELGLQIEKDCMKAKELHSAL